MDSDTPEPQGLAAPMTSLYDVFVDWPGRLAREVPGLLSVLEGVGARRVLDAGCGTGRHMGALREHGLEVHGADVSEDMLARAAAHLGSGDGLHRWRLGDPTPPALSSSAPFDAVICVGNVWPALVEPGQPEAALDAIRQLLRPGGLLVLALKAFEVRRLARDPYLPLLKRTHEGRPIWFVRFADFEVLEGEVPTCEFHMVVVRGGADDEASADMHSVRRVRLWSHEGLTDLLRARGYTDVRLAGTLAEPDEPPRGDDVVLFARVGPPEHVDAVVP